MDHLAKELRIYCEKAGCSFEYENTCKELLVHMDSNRITQVIYNLIENSCKYMNREQDAHISITCDMDKEERRIYIKVKDNGPGIEITDIPYVFDTFYRAEKCRSMQIPGAGLGLAICKYIVEAHDGEISLESRKNEGCEVRFYLNY